MQDGSKKDDDYRDDPAEFARSSELVQSGTTSRTAGGGPADSQRQVREKGSQEDWQRDASDTQQGAEVHSRSADPGQSSYGGFTNEGGADPGRDGRVEADDGTRRDDAAATRDAGRSVGGMAKSDAQLGGSLPDADGDSAAASGLGEERGSADDGAKKAGGATSS